MAVTLPLGTNVCCSISWNQVATMAEDESDGFPFASLSGCEHDLHH